jgi:4-oxalocrotonate tautomerase
MHYINIRITGEGLDDAARAALTRACIELLRQVLAAEPATTVVLIEELPLAGIGMGGLGISEYRALRA